MIDVFPAARKRTGAAWPPIVRHCMLVDRRRAVQSAFELTGLPRASRMWQIRWPWCAGATAPTALAATEPEARAEQRKPETAFTRVIHAARRILRMRKQVRGAAFAALYKFTEGVQLTTAPFVIDGTMPRSSRASASRPPCSVVLPADSWRYSLAVSLWIGGVLQAIASPSCSINGRWHSRSRRKISPSAIGPASSSPTAAPRQRNTRC